jgi:hypothetical protein
MNSNTNGTRIQLIWSNGVSNGGSPVIDYTINWDQGTGVWAVRQSNVNITSIFITLTANITFTFTVQSRNTQGLSPVSNDLSVMISSSSVAAPVPSSPGTPVTTNSGTNIVITWTAPTTGAPFVNYTIMIGTVFGTWSTTSFCDGTNATTIANL